MTDEIVRLEKVSKSFGAGEASVVAVDEVSGAFAAGEVVLIMGPSGSGKSTLLAMCGALMRPTSGRIWLRDQELTAAAESRLPDLRLHQIGFIFQSANLLGNLTAIENVRLVLEAAGYKPSKAADHAREVLGQLGLSHRLDMLPEQLSGGERQRVAIARALGNEPLVLLADEPTANLDAKAGREVMLTIQGLARERGKTVIAVSHDQRIEDVADRVLWMEDGKLAEHDGSRSSGRGRKAKPTRRRRLRRIRPRPTQPRSSDPGTAAPAETPTPEAR